MLFVQDISVRKEIAINNLEIKRENKIKMGILYIITGPAGVRKKYNIKRNCKSKKQVCIN